MSFNNAESALLDWASPPGSENVEIQPNSGAETIQPGSLVTSQPRTLPPAPGAGDLVHVEWGSNDNYSTHTSYSSRSTNSGSWNSFSDSHERFSNNLSEITEHSIDSEQALIDDESVHSDETAEQSSPALRRSASAFFSEHNSIRSGSFASEDSDDSIQKPPATPKSHQALPLRMPSWINGRAGIRPLVQSNGSILTSDSHTSDASIADGEDAEDFLPCPFKWDGCPVKFSLADRHFWKCHATKHFDSNLPPRSLVCTFENCPMIFEGEDRLKNWGRRLDHFAEHVEAKLADVRTELATKNLNSDEYRVALHQKMEIEERHDLNLLQYKTQQDGNRYGMNMLINPNPPPPLIPITTDFNRRDRAMPGPRVTQIDYSPLDFSPERELNSWTAAVFVAAREASSGERDRSERIIMR
ncbi:hypothetical protein BDZ91DRAFT_722061 [Kalaharituber pfeilii]|nr:hypothetical protein BDZ91DRAFT_722061 [Kalaharituber pfeilii]